MTLGEERKKTMTMEGYKKASVAVVEIESLELEIEGIKAIISQDASGWTMQIRKNTAWAPIEVDHCGMLNEFLDTILKKKMEKLEELMDEFKKL